MAIVLQPHPEWGSAAWAVLRTSPVERQCHPEICWDNAALCFLKAWNAKANSTREQQNDMIFLLYQR